MASRSRLRIGLILAVALLAGLVALWWQRNSPEARIASRLQALLDLMAATRALPAAECERRLALGLPEFFSSDFVLLSAEDVTVEPGRDAFVGFLGSVLCAEQRVELSAEQIRIEVQGARRQAIVRALGSLSLQHGAQVLVDTRPVVLRWRHEQEQWRAWSAEVGPATHEEPEARP
jgi:hypothetical protein